ncbi:hypothetical protein P5673_013380 [Acropora cervicornis]|uniref:Uncharacterized protein n=1 Tax=Acropora cervicornis TaxID=6130 RepID=A0AAD9V705_ACRCE|nr:hypothetical protein P5673_013380 [Acropora cervicornis]
MAAAAACRGSTATGGGGCCENRVMVRNEADRKTCGQICAQTPYSHCDGEVSVYGKEGKATKNGEFIGAFYNYGCNWGTNGGSEASDPEEYIMGQQADGRARKMPFLVSQGKVCPVAVKIATLKDQLTKADKPGGFPTLDKHGRLPRNLLSGGFDRFSAFDLAWQSLHMAAAAACRGSTASGGSGCCQNAVIVRNTAVAKTCTQICSNTIYSNCDGEVSLYGKERKASKNGETVGFFYNYKCNHGANGGSEASNSDKSVTGSGLYFSFCCCRK